MGGNVKTLNPAALTSVVGADVGRLHETVSRRPFPSEEHSSFRLRVGTIAAAFPWLGTYIVIPAMNVDTQANATVNTTPGGSTVTTVSAGGESYVPGTPVIYIEMTPAGVLTNGGTFTFRRVILAALPGEPILEERGGLVSTPAIYPGSGIDHWTETLSSAYASISKDRSAYTDSSFGSPVDVMPGDWFRAGALGPFLHVGATTTSIGSGAMARMSFDSLESRVSSRSIRSDAITPWSEQISCTDQSGGCLFRYKTAYSLLEGLGVLDNESIPFTAGTDEPTKEGQVGVWRREIYEGAAVDGSCEYTLLPESGDIRVLEGENARLPLGLSYSCSRYDGSGHSRFVSGFDIVKSYYAPVLIELSSERKLETADTDTKKWSDEHTEAWDNYSEVAASVMGYEYEWNTDKYWFKRLRERPKHWKVAGLDALAADWDIDRDLATKLDPLMATDTSYPAPDYLELEDKARGEMVKVALNEAGIRVLPDGGISITDGWGSEIRLSRGNMTITCPGDLRMLPGRDLIEITPRQRVLDVGKELYMQSAEGSISIKADRNISVMSGNSNEGGVLLLENKSKITPGEGSWRGDAPIEHGVIIKSRIGASLVSKNIYVGAYDLDDTSTNGLRRSVAGLIVLDSGSGVLSAIGGTGYLKFKNQLGLYGGEGSSVAGLALSSAAAVIMAEKLDCSTGLLRINRSTGSFSAPDYNQGGIVNDIGSAITNPPRVQIGGELTVVKNVTVGGNLRAKLVGATSGLFGTVVDKAAGAGSSGVNVTPVNVEKLDAAGKAFSKSVSEQSLMLRGSLFSSLGFYYPDSEQYFTNSLKMFRGRWQNMMADSGASTLKSVPVYSAQGAETHIWPGKKTLEATALATIELPGILKWVKFKDGYITNTGG